MTLDIFYSEAFGYDLSRQSETPMQLVPMIGGSGSSYPFVHDLELPPANAGLGYPDTRAHAPNENRGVDSYLKHARHMARIRQEFAN